MKWYWIFVAVFLGGVSGFGMTMFAVYTGFITSKHLVGVLMFECSSFGMLYYIFLKKMLNEVIVG